MRHLLDAPSEQERTQGRTGHRFEQLTRCHPPPRDIEPRRSEEALHHSVAISRLNDLLQLASDISCSDSVQVSRTEVELKAATRCPRIGAAFGQGLTERSRCSDAELGCDLGCRQCCVVRLE